MTAGDIPDHLTVDLSETEVGDVIHMSDIKLPEGATPTIDRDFVVANISAPSALRSEDDDAEDAEDAVEGGEDAAAEGGEE